MRSGRFEKDLGDAMRKLNASIHFDRRLYAEDIDGSLAWAEAMRVRGLISDEEEKLIRDGLEAIRAEIDGGLFAFSEALEDIHMNIESRLTATGSDFWSAAIHCRFPILGQQAGRFAYDSGRTHRVVCPKGFFQCRSEHSNESPEKLLRANHVCSRAASVMKWMTDKGVDRKRLVSAGYGKDEPIDTNDTEEGRANNRRVAFTILERDDSKKKAVAPAPAKP